MKYTQKIPTIALFILSAAIGNAQTLVIDDFNYTDNEEGIAAFEANWIRFGAASSDNPYLAVGDGVDGSNAAKLLINWGAGNNINLRRNNLSLDLSSYDFLNVDLYLETGSGKSSPTNPTVLKIAFQSSDETIWQTTASFFQDPSLDTYSILSFGLSEAEMSRVSGSGTFADSISSITNIRLRFENDQESGVGQNALVSSLYASTIPEPSTYALGFGVIMAGTVLLVRRKRR